MNGLSFGVGKGWLLLMMELDGQTRRHDMQAWADKAVMRFVRTIVALVIGLSVAMLPAAGSAMSAVNFAPHTGSDAIVKDMIMAPGMSGTMDECCPDDAKAKPCDRPSDQYPMACCAAQSVSIAFVAVFRLDLPVVAGHLFPITVGQVVVLHSGSPPFRPPRV